MHLQFFAKLHKAELELGVDHIQQLQHACMNAKKRVYHEVGRLRIPSYNVETEKRLAGPKAVPYSDLGPA